MGIDRGMCGGRMNQVTANMRLKELRELNDFTQEELARELDVEKVYVRRLEAGSRVFTPELVDEICVLFNCSKEYLFGESDLI